MRRKSGNLFPTNIPNLVYLVYLIEKKINNHLNTANEAPSVSQPSAKFFLQNFRKFNFQTRAQIHHYNFINWLPYEK